MLINSVCEQCGHVMSNISLTRPDGGNTTLHRCPICGYHYESGYRINRITNQFVKYIKFST